MADKKQLSILKQGVEVWNQWREENLSTIPDLSCSDLRETDLRKADLRGANLIGVNFFRADLRGVDFRGSNLVYADLSVADLFRADLREADLRVVDLYDTYLDYADLRYANLIEAVLCGVDVCGAVFNSTLFGSTKVLNTDLSSAIGTEAVIHNGPSSIGTDTLVKARGHIPENFLRGCGLSDVEIAFSKLYDPDLCNEEINTILYRIYDLRASRPIQVSPIFISYSRADADFVDRLEEKLNEYGIRFWRDIHDATSGRLEKQVDRAIRHNPTVLLILSENSTNSDWVELEVTMARELEKELDRDVLCPIALDDSWKTCKWPARIMNQVKDYNVLDFSEWGNSVRLDEMFVRLIKGLDLYYNK